MIPTITSFDLSSQRWPISQRAIDLIGSKYALSVSLDLIYMISTVTCGPDSAKAKFTHGSTLVVNLFQPIKNSADQSPAKHQRHTTPNSPRRFSKSSRRSKHEKTGLVLTGLKMNLRMKRDYHHQNQKRSSGC